MPNVTSSLSVTLHFNFKSRKNVTKAKSVSVFYDLGVIVLYFVSFDTQIIHSTIDQPQKINLNYYHICLLANVTFKYLSCVYIIQFTNIGKTLLKFYDYK